VNFATVQGRGHVLAPREAGFEDGTLNYLSIPAVEIGLRHLERVGIDAIQTRTGCLTAWLLTELQALRHANGREVVRLYGPATSDARGATVTMNFHDSNGTLLDFPRVEELAAQEGISIRTGCFCNPGAGETAEHLTEDDMRAGAGGRRGADAAALPSGDAAARRQEPRRDPPCRSGWRATSPTSIASYASPPASGIRRSSRSAR